VHDLPGEVVVNISCSYGSSAWRIFDEWLANSSDGGGAGSEDEGRIMHVAWMPPIPEEDDSAGERLGAGRGGGEREVAERDIQREKETERQREKETER
jgi:hypothetical protein